MKNKWLTYLLLTAALVIWAMIVKRMVSFTKTETTPTAGTLLRSVADSTATDMELLLDYRDPFIDMPAPKTKETDSTQNFPTALPIPPEIKFKGIVIKDKVLYGIISSKGSTDIVSQGDIVEGYIVRSMNPDSLVFQKEGFNYSIYRDS